MSSTDLLYIFFLCLLAGAFGVGFFIGWWARGQRELDWPPSPAELLDELRRMQRDG